VWPCVSAHTHLLRAGCRCRPLAGSRRSIAVPAPAAVCTQRAHTAQTSARHNTQDFRRRRGGVDWVTAPRAASRASADARRTMLLVRRQAAQFSGRHSTQQRLSFAAATPSYWCPRVALYLADAGLLTRGPCWVAPLFRASSPTAMNSSSLGLDMLRRSTSCRMEASSSCGGCMSPDPKPSNQADVSSLPPTRCTLRTARPAAFSTWDAPTCV